MVIPFLILRSPRLSSRPGWIGAAAFMVAADFVLVRINAVLPAFVAPQLEGLESAFTDSRLTYDYFPSSTEWLVAVFIGAVVLGLFYLGYRLLPLVSEPKEV